MGIEVPTGGIFHWKRGKKYIFFYGLVLFWTLFSFKYSVGFSYLGDERVVMKSLIFCFFSICWLLFSFVVGACLEGITGFDKGRITIVVFVLGGFILLGVIGCLQHLLVQWVVKLRSKGSI
ncbi:MAG: hypothetical protein GY858_09200 [Candidatus Omnitrophica bacterium]|nr:hypothetical protein [Candidatus Omnitrophota bacterium]